MGTRPGERQGLRKGGVRWAGSQIRKVKESSDRSYLACEGTVSLRGPAA